MAQLDPKFEEKVADRLKMVMQQKGKTVPNDLKSVVTVSHDFKKKESLGLLHRHGMITRVNFDSPLKGKLMVADVIVMVNGIDVGFDEPAPLTACQSATSTIGGKSTIGKASTMSKASTMKKPSTISKMSTSLGRKKKLSQIFRFKAPLKDFKTVVTGLLANGDAKLEITVIRFRIRNDKIEIPPGVWVPPESGVEQVIIFQFKYLKLGLNMQLVDDRVVVNYTVPDSVSHVSLNIGEAILTVDEHHVHTLEAVRQRIIDGCNERGFVRLLVEFPTKDPMRNMIRNCLANAERVAERPNFAMWVDVRKFADVGIETLKTAKEPAPILKGTNADQKKRMSNVFEFRDKTRESDVPSEWNTRLFVALLPKKTKESETAPAPSPENPENPEKEKEKEK